MIRQTHCQCPPSAPPSLLTVLDGFTTEPSISNKEYREAVEVLIIGRVKYLKLDA